MTQRLQAKVAIITGAAGGIGAAIAQRFAEEGASVGVVDLNATAAEATAQRMATTNGVRTLGLACDEDQVQDCVKAAVDHFGRIDIVVNNAGLMTFKSLCD